MKTIVVLAVSIVLVSILFCPMAIAVPTMPADLQMVQPDSSLPKELSAFFGKWESIPYPMAFFVIVEKIDKEKASLYVWRSGGPAWPEGTLAGWERIEAKVFKDRGKYKVWYQSRIASSQYTLKGEYLDLMNSSLSPFKRVP